MSRKKFLEVAGSFIAGGAIVGTSAYLLLNRSKSSNNCTDKQLSSKCETCKIDCPLRKGVTF